MVQNASGTIRGGGIELDDRLDLPDGTRVTLQVEPADDLATRREAMRRLAGSITDPTFFEAMEEIERQRHAEMPRTVDLDEAT